MAFILLEYNIVVHKNPVKNNVLADELSRRPDYVPSNALSRHYFDDDDVDKYVTCVALNLTRVVPKLYLHDKIVVTYALDPDYADIIA